MDTPQQELQDRQRRMDTLQQELRTKDQQLQDSQRRTHTLQQELQDSQRRTHTLQQELQRQIQQLTHQVEEKQHTIDDRETQLRQVNGQLQANEQVTAEFQRNLLQHEQTNRRLQETVRQLRRDLQQAVEEKQAGERQLQKPKTQQLELMKQTAAQPQIALMQQKTIRDMKLWKESKAPEEMFRGSTASDSNTVYFNGNGSTKVYNYDSETQKWHQLPDTPLTQSTLVVVQHILTMVGGHLSGKVTNSLLSLMGEGRTMKWLPHFPEMPTARQDTAAACSGHSLIVAGGRGDSYNHLAIVEVLDTDTQQWSTACSLPHPFSEATVSICNEQLYLTGGYDKTGWRRSVLTCSVPELLQCETQSLAEKLQTVPAKQTTKWRHVADAPYNCSSCATLCGQLVAVGGREGDKDTSGIFAYKETTDSWEAMGDMPTARCLALVAILNGKLMVVGGQVGVYGYLGLWWTATDVVEILR